jgi:hypothetical protein
VNDFSKTPSEPVGAQHLAEATVRTDPGSLLLSRGPVMVVVCSWCQSVERLEPTTMKRTELSHGICPGCLVNARAGIAEFTKEKACAA